MIGTPVHPASFTPLTHQFFLCCFIIGLAMHCHHCNHCHLMAQTTDLLNMKYSRKYPARNFHEIKHLAAAAADKI